VGGIAAAGASPPPAPLALSGLSWNELVEQGNAAVAAGDNARAVLFFEQAARADPENADVLFKLGELYVALGNVPLARERLSSGLRIKEDPTARAYLGYIEEISGNFRLAIVHFRKVLETDPQNVYVLTHLGLSYQQIGNARDAVTTLDKARGLDPDGDAPETENLDRYLGLAYEDLQRDADALEAYRRAEARTPNDAWIARRMGSVYERMGDLEEARAAYERAYALDPTDAAARAAVEAIAARLAQEEEEASVEPVQAVSLLPDDISDRILAAPDPEDMPGADAVILLNRSEHEVLDDGRSRFTVHHVAKLLHRRAIAAYGEVAIPFNAAAQNIGVNVAHTILPDGTVVEVDDDAIHDVTPPDTLAFNLYSDILWKVISFPALGEGAVIEYRVTVEDAHPAEGSKAVWFWGSMTFQAEHPTMASQYALRIPAGVPIKWKVYNARVQPDVSRSSDAAGGESATYVWQYGQTSAYVEEPNGPALETTAPRLAFSSVPSWQELHDWYRGLVADRLTPDEAIVEEATRIAAGHSTQEERIRAIADAVAQDTRYVAIQLGQGAYQPHAAATVLERRYGDCKDKAALLIAMLRVIGVEAHPGLLAPAPDPDVDTDLPSLAPFRHMIVAIPSASGHTWVDPTESTLSFGRLPARNQGRKVLLIQPGGVAWAVTPFDAPERNRHDWQAHFILDETGALEATETVTATGKHAADLRAVYQPVSPPAEQQFLAQALSLSYPGVALREWWLSGTYDLNMPVVVRAMFDVPQYGQRTSETWAVPIPGADFAPYASLAAAEVRRGPLVLGVPNVLTRQLTVVLPPGFAVAGVPPPITFTSPFAELDRAYQVDDNLVEYSLTLRVVSPLIAPEDYPAARRLFSLLAAEETAVLSLRYSAPLAAAPPVPEEAESASVSVEPEARAPAEPLPQEPSQTATATPDGAAEPPSDATAVAARAEPAGATAPPPLAEVQPSPPTPTATGPSAVEEPAAAPATEPSAPEPNATTTETATAPSTETLDFEYDGPYADVADRIRSWKRAWEAKNYEEYIGVYAPVARVNRYSRDALGRLVTETFERSRFEEKVRFQFGRYALILISIRDVDIAAAPDNQDEYVAEFVQEFSGWRGADVGAPSYEDIGVKTLRFRREDGEWWIAEENWRPLTDAELAGRSRRAERPPTAAPAASPEATTGPVAVPEDGRAQESSPTAPDVEATAEEAAVMASVEEWRAAWQARDVTQYLDQYANDAIVSRSALDAEGRIVTGVMTKQELRAKARNQFAGYRRLQVRVDGLTVVPSADASGDYVAQFEQEFSGWRAATGADPDYTDRGRKVLRFRRVGRAWRIAAEEWRPLPTDTATPPLETALSALALPLGPPRGATTFSGPAGEVAARLADWRRTWEANDVDGYMALYADSARIFRVTRDTQGRVARDLLTKAELDEHMRRLVERYARLEVLLRRLNVVEDTAQPGDILARAEQEFTAWAAPRQRQPTYRDRGVKTFRFRRDGDAWRIVEETWEPLPTTAR
jgi:tetratricopeptide (TPR) repeat protein/ketosteroid isomerase-like protein